MVASGGCLHIFLCPTSHGYLSQGHRRSCLVGCSEALVLSELILSIIQEPIPLLSTQQAQVEPDWNWNYSLANSRATNKDIGTRRTLALPTAKATTERHCEASHRPRFYRYLLGRTIGHFEPSLGTTRGADMSYI